MSRADASPFDRLLTHGLCALVGVAVGAQLVHAHYLREPEPVRSSTVMAVGFYEDCHLHSDPLDALRHSEEWANEFPDDPDAVLDRVDGILHCEAD